MKAIITAIILLLLIMFMAEYSHGADISIGYGLGCVHLGDTKGKDYNETNHIIMFQYNQITGITFNNSHYDRSHFIGYTWEPYQYNITNNSYVTFNLHIGILYGYEDMKIGDSDWGIAGAPTIELGYKQFSFETLIVPVDGGVITGIFKYSF